MTPSVAKTDKLLAAVRRGAAISAITPRPADPNLRIVRVDGKAVVTLNAADLESLGLKVGQSWSVATAKSVAKALAHNAARKAAIRMLGSSASSRRRLEEKLIARAHDPAIVKTVAGELQRDHWLDDRAYAESVVRHAIRSKPASEQFLMRKLSSRGIDPSLAQRVVREALAAESPDRQVEALARSTWESCTNLARPKATRRVAAALVRRGFDDDVIEQALVRIGLRSEDARLDAEPDGETA